MARRITSGFETQVLSTNGPGENGENQAGADGISANAQGTGVSIQTGTINPGGSAAALRVLTNAGAMQWVGMAIANGTGAFLRFYFRYSATPTANWYICRLIDSVTGQVCGIQMTTAGKLRLINAAGTQIGSDTAVLGTGTWFRVEVTAALAASPTSSNGLVSAAYAAWQTSYDSTTIASSAAANLGTIGIDGLEMGSNAAGPGSGVNFYFDDVALNDGTGSAPHNALPAGGHVQHALPISDSAVGTGWEQPKTTGSDTTDLYDSVNNVPPTGVAHSDVDANNLKYVFNAANLGASSSLDLNCQTYNTLGIESNTITLAQGLVRTGGASTTGTNDGNARMTSNPVDASATSLSAAYDIVSGTDPTSWQTFRTKSVMDPSVTRANSPIMRVQKTLTGSTRAHLVDYMAVVIEYADTLVVLATSAGVSTATVTLTAPTFITLGASAGLSTATLVVTAPTTVPLGTSAGASTASLAVTAPTTVALDTSSGQSTATLSLSALTTITLGASAGVSSATLAVGAPTTIALGTSTGLSNATLAVTAPALVPLSSSAGQSSATLSLTAPAIVPLDSAAATSSASLSLTSTTQVPLDASSGTTSATLALTASTTVALGTSAGQSDATLSLTALTAVPLGAAQGQSSATIDLSATPAVAFLTLETAGQSDALLALSAQTSVLLHPATGEPTTCIVVSVPSQVPLDPADGLSSATLDVGAPANVVLQEAFGISAATLVIHTIHAVRWEGDTDSRWVASSDERWTPGAGERWPDSADDRWDEGSEDRWTPETETQET